MVSMAESTIRAPTAKETASRPEGGGRVGLRTPRQRPLDASAPCIGSSIPTGELSLDW